MRVGEHSMLCDLTTLTRTACLCNGIKDRAEMLKINSWSSVGMNIDWVHSVS